MTVYGFRTHLPPLPEHRAQGCPHTGWVREGGPPYRVIVSEDPTALASVGDPKPYDGAEDTVDYESLFHITD